MSKRRESNEELSLARRLRQEARRSRPEFSETLHRRIIRSVEGQRMEGAAAASRTTAAGRRRRGLAAVLAAACALAAAAIGWRLGEYLLYRGGAENQSALAVIDAPPPQLVESQGSSDAEMDWPLADLPPMYALADQAATGLDDLLASAGLTLPSRQLAHDARLAADSLLERLPVDVELADDR